MNKFMAKKDVSNEDLAVMIKKGFDGADKRFDKVEGRLTKVEGRLTKVEGRLTKVEGRLTKVEATVVTKNYLDEKLSDLRGDLVVLMRKEDNKVRKLVDVLKKRKVITAGDAKEILAMEPFPELNLHFEGNS
jgi:predicted  nucleic acid-binding Zn-ribbon protein